MRPVTKPLGVGIIGAGAATQSIHLPILASLRGRLRVTHIVARDERIAATIAARAGARSGTSVAALLEDPAVDLVAVCSPHRYHSEHVTAACAAGKRGILVEKPLALTEDEAVRIRDASSRFGVPIVVGSMHGWDPAWHVASKEWLESGRQTRLIRSAIHLPVNDMLIDLTTDLVGRRQRHARRLPPGLRSRIGALRRQLRPPDLMARDTLLRDGILTLAVHAIPLIRLFAPDPSVVTFARPTLPWGYSVVYDAGPAAVTMTGSIGGRWAPMWTFDAWAEDRHLHIDFPPAYVMAGSGEASILTATGRQSWRFPYSGYLAEWLHLADVADGRAELMISVATAVDDIVYAISVAAAAAGRLYQDSADMPA
jgi:predicted dehydrogenase